MCGPSISVTNVLVITNIFVCVFVCVFVCMCLCVALKQSSIPMVSLQPSDTEYVLVVLHTHRVYIPGDTAHIVSTEVPSSPLQGSLPSIPYNREFPRNITQCPSQVCKHLNCKRL